MRTQFLKHNPVMPEPPCNRISVIQGDSLTECDEPSDVNKGLTYSDFSAQSLIDAGAVDLLSGQSKLMSNDINDIDLISKLEKSPIVEHSKQKPKESPKEDIKSQNEITQ